MDNLEVSVAVLKKLTEEWKQQNEKQSSLEGLQETLKSFRHKVLPFFFVIVAHINSIINTIVKYCVLFVCINSTKMSNLPFYYIYFFGRMRKH